MFVFFFKLRDADYEDLLFECVNREKTVKELIKHSFYKNINFLKLLLRQYNMYKEVKFNYKELFYFNSEVLEADHYLINNISFNDFNSFGSDLHPNSKFYKNL